MSPALYNCKSTPSGYRITKFDADLNVEASYEVTDRGCTCPQGHRSACRHRVIALTFANMGRRDSDWFYEYETLRWAQPLALPEAPRLRRRV